MCKLVNKDTLISTAMGVINAQYRMLTASSSSSSSSFPSMREAVTYLLACVVVDIKQKNVKLPEAKLVSPLLSTPLVTSMLYMPITSKAAVLRGILGVFPIEAFITSTCDNKPMLHDLVHACGEGLVFKDVAAVTRVYVKAELNNNEETRKDHSHMKDVLRSSIHSTILSMCNHSKPYIQFYGLQILELWLQRVEEYIVAQDFTSGIGFLLERLMDITALLTHHWSHPSKKVSHLVPAVYQRLVDLISFIEMNVITTEAFPTMNSCNTVFDIKGNDHKTDIWNAFIERALSLPIQHRARYQALNMLLPKIGSSRFLKLQPNIIKSLLPFTMKVRDIASSVCNFLTTLLHGIINDQDKKRYESRNFPNRHGAVRKNKEKYTTIDGQL